ncbi:MAG: carbohydrate ABC transporter permease [Anaerolineae bacterium]
MKKFAIVTYAVAWLIGVLWILPFVGVFMASVRPFSEVVDGWWHFQEFTLTLGNFAEAWNHPTAPMGRGLFNSMSIVIPATVLTITIASLGGYAFARFRFRLKGPLFFAIILIMAMSPQAIAVPLTFQMVKLGLVDTRVGLILVQTTWGLPWSILFLRNFFLSLPEELEDAARVDGASEFTVFRKIVFPLARPAVLSVATLQFIFVWNEFFFALLFLHDPGKWVATQGIPLIKGRYFVNWSLVSAASMMTMMVPLIVFLSLQKYYIRGVMAGAIKG